VFSAHGKIHNDLVITLILALGFLGLV